MALRELSDTPSSATVCEERAAGTLTPSLRTRVRDLALAPLRLHRYRDVHSMMLRDALCKLDCKKVDR
ncbi:MAG: hypothetical protein AAF417_09045 [Pseudomonadota bacterium]